MKATWSEVFGHGFSPAIRSLVFELADVRNNWAHEKPFTYDQPYRALDTVRMLLEAISAKKEAERAGASRRRWRVGCSTPDGTETLSSHCLK